MPNGYARIAAARQQFANLMGWGWTAFGLLLIVWPNDSEVIPRWVPDVIEHSHAIGVGFVLAGLSALGALHFKASSMCGERWAFKILTLLPCIGVATLVPSGIWGSAESGVTVGALFALLAGATYYVAGLRVTEVAYGRGVD